MYEFLHTRHLYHLVEGKAIGDYKRTKVDLRALEARAWALVHKNKYHEVLRKKKASADNAYRIEKGNYERRFSKHLNDFKRGKISKKRLIEKVSQEIRVEFQKAYSLGLSAQGHGALAAPARPRGYTSPNLDTDDAKWVRSAADEEIGYFKEFVRDLEQNFVPEDDDDPDTRADKVSRSGKKFKQSRKNRTRMYVNTLDSVYFAGQVRGAPTNVIIHWVYGDAIHCPECIYLEMNSPYTRDTLPTTPRAGCTRCLSNCKCTLAFEYPLGSKFEKTTKTQHSQRHYMLQLKRSRKNKNGLPMVRTRLMKEEALDRVRSRVASNTRRFRRP